VVLQDFDAAFAHHKIKVAQTAYLRYDMALKKLDLIPIQREYDVCHAERSEASRRAAAETLRGGYPEQRRRAQGDRMRHVLVDLVLGCTLGFDTAA
jgi:hypothetical protein